MCAFVFCKPYELRQMMSVQTIEVHNLPSQPTPFIGREPEIAEIVGLLQDDGCRLLTLLGAGGMGKTRLSIESIQRLTQDDFEHGVFYVPLAPLTSADNIVTTVIGVLGIMIGDEGTPQEELVKFFSQRNLLLVMDNFEHVLDGADLVADILHTASNIKILVTSREALNLRMERVWHVRGMRYPDTEQPNDINQYSALKLFIDRATWVRREFSPDTELACAIQICQLVGGMPLAIELSASWLKTLTCSDVVKEIENGIDFLTTRARDIPERHRSIRAVFDHSWQLLNTDEQIVFARLAVFRNGFTLDAAKQIVNASFVTLSGLLDKSMVRQDSAGRYGVHELLRQYAEERLELTDETEAIYTSHMLFYAQFMQDREIDLKSDQMLDGVDKIEADYENIVQAWNNAIQAKNHEAVYMMIETFWQFQFIRYVDSIAIFKPAFNKFAPLPDETPHPVWGRILSRTLHFIDDDSIATLQEALEIAQASEDKMEIAYCLQTLGVVHLRDVVWLIGRRQRSSIDIPKAIGFYERSLEVFQEIDDNFGIADVYDMLGNCYQARGDINTAFQYFLKGLTLSRAIDNKMRIVRVLCSIALTALDAGRWREAEDYAQEALAITHAMSDRWGGDSYFVLGLLSLLQGQFDRTRYWIQEALSWSVQRNASGIRYVALRLASWLASLEGRYVESKGLLKESQELSLDIQIHRLDERVPAFNLVLFVSDLRDEQFVREYSFNVLKSAVTQQSIGLMLWILPSSAIMVAHYGKQEWAVELLSLAFNHLLSLTGWMEKWQYLNQLRAELEAELGTEAYQAAWERGAQLDLDETVAELLVYLGDDDAPDSTQPKSQPLAEPLTGRELEVLALIADGLTNPQIAEKLYLSVGTVKVHTRNIYGKLNVSNRTEATTKARDLNLI